MVVCISNLFKKLHIRFLNVFESVCRKIDNPVSISLCWQCCERFVLIVVIWVIRIHFTVIRINALIQSTYNRECSLWISSSWKVYSIINFANKCHKLHKHDSQHFWLQSNKRLYEGIWTVISTLYWMHLVMCLGKLCRAIDTKLSSRGTISRPNYKCDHNLH